MNVPLYGRKYNVTVALPGNNGNGDTQVITISDSDNEPEALRVTFDIQQRAFQVFWYADINIYNLDQATTQQLLGNQMQDLVVTVSAGYQKGSYGVIWTGPVFQPLFERENATDFKVTLHCILGLVLERRNYIDKNFAAGITQADMMKQIADSAFVKIPVQKISNNLKKATLPRGKTVFGNPGRYFRQIAEDNNMQWWLGDKGLAMGFPDEDLPEQVSPELTFSPPLLPTPNTAGQPLSNPANGVIIGTPIQTQYGVFFRALLNPNVGVRIPIQKIKIDNALLRKQKLLLDPNGTGPAKISLLDQDGEYAVAGARFIGDTRGPSWYVDVDGYATTGDRLQMILAGTKPNVNNG